MKNIEILFVDEKKLPISGIEKVKSANNNLYFLGGNLSEGVQVNNMGQMYSGKYAKKTINISGEDLYFASLGSDAFVLDDYALYKINKENKMSEADAHEITGQLYFEFADLASDGKNLYLQSDKSPGIVVVDKDLNLKKIMRAVSDEIISGNKCFWVKRYNASEKQDYFDMYLDGEKKESRNVKKFDQSYFANLNRLVDCFNNDEPEIDQKIKFNKLNFPKEHIVGNKGIYLPMSQGQIYYLTKKGGVDLGVHFPIDENLFVEGTFNDKYTFIFNGDKAGVFDGEKQLGENEFNMDISKILGMTADKEFVYALTDSDTLQRYKIIE